MQAMASGVFLVAAFAAVGVAAAVVTARLYRITRPARPGRAPERPGD